MGLFLFAVKISLGTLTFFAKIFILLSTKQLFIIQSKFDLKTLKKSKLRSSNPIVVPPLLINKLLRDIDSSTLVVIFMKSSCS